MKKILLITLTALFAFMSMEGFAQSQRKKRAAIFTNPQNYDAQVIAVGTTGTKYIYVSGTGKKLEGALFQAQQNAIHACIFKNIPGTPQAEGVPALYDAQEPKPEDEEFFDEFFAPDGMYLSFIANRSTLKPEGKDVVDIGKGYFQVRLKVQVSYDQLKKYLVDNGKVKAFAADLQGVAKPKMIIFPSDEWCKKAGYTDKNGNPDYNKALSDDNLRDMIATFEGFMSKAGYEINDLRQELNDYKTSRAYDAAEEYGNEKAATMKDMLESAVRADMRIEFDYRMKNEAGKQYVEFNIGVYDAATNKALFSNVARGTAVSGNAQLVNQLKEAIQNIQDHFLSQINEKFAKMAKEGREIIVVCDRFASCDITFNSTFDGDKLSLIINDYVESEVVEGTSFTTDIATANKLKYSQVHIPLFKEKKNRRTGKTTTVAQYAKDFGDGLAAYITEVTGEPCRVEPRGVGRVFITLGIDATEEE
ncbi:MAG: hypothetical protein J5708_01965 [Bacteroidales bacterium]|nr:hypothetical protein [Bacteroidales bacterium]